MLLSYLKRPKEPPEYACMHVQYIYCLRKIVTCLNHDRTNDFEIVFNVYHIHDHDRKETTSEKRLFLKDYNFCRTNRYNDFQDPTQFLSDNACIYSTSRI